jgi:hypothetical protein
MLKTAIFKRLQHENSSLAINNPRTIGNGCFYLDAIWI